MTPLRQRFIEDMQLRNLAPTTQRSYRERDQQQSKTLTISAEEFIRRFLLHTLPKGFQRIRYFGSWPIVSGKKNLLSAANCCMASAAIGHGLS